MEEIDHWNVQQSSIYSTPVATLSFIRSPTLAQESVKGSSNKAQSPILSPTRTCTDSVSPTHTLIHSSPELPPLPSFTYLQDYPRTPKASSARRRIGTDQYYTASWGSPYSQPPSGSQDQANLAGYDEAFGSGCLDNESPDIRFSLTHLLPSRNLNFTSSASRSDIKVRPTPRSFYDGVFNTCNIHTAVRSGEGSSDELASSVLLGNSNTESRSFWDSCEIGKKQSFLPQNFSFPTSESAVETQVTSSDSSTPVRKQSRNKEEQKCSGYHLGHKSRKENLTLKPENFIRLTAEGMGDIVGTMLQSKYADPAFEANKKGSNDSQERVSTIGLNDSSETAKGLEPGLHGSTGLPADSPQGKALPGAEDGRTPSLKRVRKRITSRRGKPCIIHLPLSIYERTQPKVPPSSLEESRTTEREKNKIEIPRDCDVFSQNCEIFPDPKEDEHAKSEKTYLVRIPDRSEWEKYMNELREQKLRALGVSIDDEKSVTSMSRQSSLQNPNSTSTPPLLNHFTGMQPSRSSISHVVSPLLTSSSPNPFANGSNTSPLPILGKSIPLVPGQRTVSPAFGFNIPFRQSSSSPAWSPQPPLSQNGNPYNISPMVATNAMSTNDKLSHEVSELSKSQMNESMLLRLQQSQQQYNSITRPRSTLQRVPEGIKEDAISPKTVTSRPVEIVVPVPRGHRQNISASLEEDIKDAEYHLEKAIDRQLGEDGEFDLEPAHSRTSSSVRGTGEFKLNYEMPKPHRSSARVTSDAHHAHLPGTAQLMKDARSLGDISAGLLHSRSIDANSTDSKTVMSPNANEGQFTDTALASEERRFSGQLPSKLKDSHILANKNDKPFKESDSNKNKANKQAERSKFNLSNLNAGAQEFSLHEKRSPSALPFSVSDFSINQGLTKPITSSRQLMKANFRNAAFNVTAPSFTPRNPEFGSKLPTKNFNFLSSGPLFKPEAPEFVPQNISNHSPLTSAENKISSNPHTMSERIFPFFNYENKNTARKPRTATHHKQGVICQPQADQEDEEGRITRANDKQKRARRGIKDGDEVPRFALHPQPASGTARVHLDKIHQTHDVHLSENKENEAPLNTVDDNSASLGGRGNQLSTLSASVSNISKPSKGDTEVGSTEERNGKSESLGMQSGNDSDHHSITNASGEALVQILEKETEDDSRTGFPTTEKAERDGSTSLDKNNDVLFGAENHTQQAQSHEKTHSSTVFQVATSADTSKDSPVVSQISENDSIPQSNQSAERAHLEVNNTALVEDLGLLDPSIHVNQNKQSREFGRTSPSSDKSHQSSENFQQLNRNQSPNQEHSISQAPNLQEAKTDDLANLSHESEQLYEKTILERQTKNSEGTDVSGRNTSNQLKEDSIAERKVIGNVIGGTVGDLKDAQKSTSEYRTHRIRKYLHKVEANNASRIGPLDSKDSELDSDADDEDDELHTSQDCRKYRLISDHRTESMKNVIAETVASQQDILAAIKSQQDFGIDIIKVLDEVHRLRTEVKSLGLPGQMSGSRLSRSATDSHDDFEADSLTTAVNSILLSVAELRSERDLNVQVSELKGQLKDALVRANCAEDAKNDAEHKLSAMQQSLEANRAEAAHHVLQDYDAHTRISHDKNPDESCSRSSQSTVSEREDNNMHSEVHRLTAEVEALSSTLEEYRVSSSKWRSEIDQSHENNEMLKGTMSNIKSQLEEALRVRDIMQSKLETLQENLLKAVGQAANDKAYWQQMDQESRNKHDLLSVKHEIALKSNAKLEKLIERLEGEEREAVKLRIMHDQSQKSNFSLSETINQLRAENVKLEALVAHLNSVSKEAKENSHAEAERIKIVLNAEVEVAKNQTDAARLDMQAEVSNLQAQLHELTEKYESAKVRYEQQFQKQIDAEMLAIRDALQTKDAALKDNSRVHEENVANLKSHHEDILNQKMEDKQRSEAHLNDRLDFTQDKVNHLRDKVAYLQEKLKVSESAAQAAALAAQSANTPTVDQQSEKVSPKALRETIQALQEQLQEREQRIENLEGQVSSFDTEAPSKLKEREAEVGWLRELFSVRIDDLSDLVSTLSHSDYDPEIVRDAAIRIKASLQMEQQERERLMAGDRPFPSFPNVATISNFASPKAAQLAAAIGNWRKGKETARLFQRPQSASSSESTTPAKMSAQPNGFLSGLMTPPASNLRRTPDTQSSSSRRRAPGRLSNATDLPILEPKLREKQSAPVTPPLLGQCSYDDDAESGQFSISRFQEDDTASMLGSRYEEEERQGL